MTPIEGLVVKAAGPSMKIKLISGRTLTVPRVKDLSFGDKVWVCINYTNMTVKDIMTDYEYHELDKEKEIDLSPELDPESGFIKGKVLGDSVFLSD